MKTRPRHMPTKDGSTGDIDPRSVTLAATNRDQLLHWAKTLTRTIHRGHRVLVASDTTSAASAKYLSTEFAGIFVRPHRPPVVLALAPCPDSASSVDGEALDCRPDVLAQQVHDLGRESDVLMTFSADGDGFATVIAAVEANVLGLRTLAVTRPTSNLAQISDDTIAIPDTANGEVRQRVIAAELSAIVRHIERSRDHRRDQE